jgi:hypothetical protein
LTGFMEPYRALEQTSLENLGHITSHSHNRMEHMLDKEDTTLNRLVRIDLAALRRLRTATM